MSASSWPDAVAVETREGEWSLATRIAFRFVFGYSILTTQQFTYRRSDPKTVIVDGHFESKPIHGVLHNADRGFHWINETPFNR